MEELLKLLLSIQPATLAILAVAGYALERRIRALENRSLSMETKLDLLLNGHRMKGDNGVPASIVGPYSGSTGPGSR